MKVFLTSGGTKTPIDSVRHVGNMSKGTFGCHLCNAFLKMGHTVHYFYAKDSKAPHDFRLNLKEVGSREAMETLLESYDFLDDFGDRYIPMEYSDFNSYAEGLKKMLGSGLFDLPDVVVLAAAVSDYAPVKHEGKISSDLDKMVIEFEKTPKLIRQIRDFCPKTFLVGFKLLVGSTQDELLEAMKKQMKVAKTDMVVGNDLRDIRADKHSLTILQGRKKRLA